MQRSKTAKTIRLVASDLGCLGGRERSASLELFVIFSVFSTSDLENLCSTRRSAGVPHMVTAILATEPPDHPNESMNVAMMSLLEMRNKGMIYRYVKTLGLIDCKGIDPLLFRVHSFNVLKAIFSSAALGERVIPALEVDGCFVFLVMKCSVHVFLFFFFS